MPRAWITRANRTRNALVRRRRGGGGLGGGGMASTPKTHMDFVGEMLQYFAEEYPRVSSCRGASELLTTTEIAKWELESASAEMPQSLYDHLNRTIQQAESAAEGAFYSYCREKDCKKIPVRETGNDLNGLSRAEMLNTRRQRGLRGLELPPEGHRQDALVMFQYLVRKPPPNSCKDSVKILALAIKADAAAQHSRDPELRRVALETLKRTKSDITRTCRERNSQVFELAGLSRAEMMNTRGFKDGRKSWIDVMPAGGPKMRVTHEILEGLGNIWKKIPKAERVRLQRRIDRLPRIGRGVGEKLIKAKDAAAFKQAMAETERERAEDEAFLLTLPEEMRRSIKRIDAALFDQDLKILHEEAVKSLALKQAIKAKRRKTMDGFEGVGSSFALMWAAAGAAALMVLSNAQQPAYAKGLAPDLAREVIFNDLNRARAAQGLPPLTR